MCKAERKEIKKHDTWNRRNMTSQMEKKNKTGTLEDLKKTMEKKGENEVFSYIAKGLKADFNSESDKDFNEFLDDLDKWYEHKTNYLKLCKEIDDHFGGHDKVPGDLGEYDMAYEYVIESLTALEYNLFEKWTVKKTEDEKDKV